MSIENKQEIIVRNVLLNSNSKERELFINWANEIISLKKSALSRKEKAKKAIIITHKSKIVMLLVKKIATEFKKIGWDRRSWRARAGLSTILITLLTVGNSTGGLAFFGGAVAIPMWVLFGSGATVLAVVIEEFSPTKINKDSIKAKKIKD